jgi:metal-responsive CopG/Arc/MetJ family transcriptional regulator
MSSQLAVRVTDAQLRALDEYAAFRGYATRADAIRAAIAEAIKRADDEAIDRSYREGYARIPETAAEMADAHRLAVASINEEPSRLEDWV